MVEANVVAKVVVVMVVVVVEETVGMVEQRDTLQSRCETAFFQRIQSLRIGSPQCRRCRQ